MHIFNNPVTYNICMFCVTYRERTVTCRHVEKKFKYLQHFITVSFSLVLEIGKFNLASPAIVYTVMTFELFYLLWLCMSWLFITVITIKFKAEITELYYSSNNIVNNIKLIFWFWYIDLRKNIQWMPKFGWNFQVFIELYHAICR